MEHETIKCPFCGVETDAKGYYCSNCGKKIREIPLSTSVSSQLLIYFISLFMPPFGLGYTIKYLKSPNQKAKTIGIVSLAFTIISLVIVTIYTVKLTQNFSKQLNTQLNQYQSNGL